ncbi:MAG: [Clostridia bacterium]|nr:[FeFe] hydrogenase H-cluster radical SAM maturase HydE [Clostridia bacterium]
MKQIIDKLKNDRDLTDKELLMLIEEEYDVEYLYSVADEVRREYYEDKVYIRGLIEISNYCKNDCLYCGIRCSNKNAVRYRLTEDEILDCCKTGYELGFRTFVMQGGEDGYFTDEVMCRIISEIKSRYPNCAVTLSLGERSRDSYQRLYDAGADRYLLRHETANAAHYSKLHPKKMELETRKHCLFDLKEIGYQTGSGFMVGSPYQTPENLVEDLRFLQELIPDMIGIGPFITHRETPFSKFESGSFEKTLKLISILRLMFPRVLLPATTALGTIHPNGREMGLRAGANVVMPNLSPMASRRLYALYDNKISTGEEAAESVALLSERVRSAGYRVVVDRGDVLRI